MSILDHFDSEMNKTATVKIYSSGKDDEGRTVEAYINGVDIVGFLEIRQEGTQLVGDKYQPLYREYFLHNPPKTVEAKDRLLIDSVLYEIDFIDDIANQGEVIELGLNRIE